MHRYCLVLGLVALLAACTHVDRQTEGGLNRLPVPAQQISLNQEVLVPGGYARVFFQRGKLLAKADLDHYHPHCDLEIRTLNETDRAIYQGHFIITHVVFGQEPIVAREGVRLAGLSWSHRWWEGGHSIYRYVRMNLHSEEQPDVMRLTCHGALDDYHRAEYPSRMDMILALGKLVTLP